MNNRFDEFATQYHCDTFENFKDSDELVWLTYVMNNTDYVVTRAIELNEALPSNYSNTRQEIRARIRELRGEQI